MPRTGRPPKPVELKRRLGNPGRRPLPAPIVSIAPVVSTAQVPRFSDGDEMLQSMLDSGASTFIGPTDVAAADVARRVWTSQAVAERRWLADPDDKEAFRAYRDLTELLNKCLSSLGLDPPSRGRLGVVQVKTRSVLEELAAKREARVAGRRAT